MTGTGSFFCTVCTENPEILMEYIEYTGIFDWAPLF